MLVTRSRLRALRRAALRRGRDTNAKRRRRSTLSRPSGRLQGDPDPELLLAGHSHRVALKRALSEGLVEPPMRTAVLVKKSDGDVHDYWTALRRYAGGRTAAIAWLGNQWATDFLFGEAPFAMALPGPFEGTPGARGMPFVTERLLRAYYEPSLRELEALLADLTHARRLIVLGTPPPNRDDVVRSAVLRHGKLRRRLEESGLDPRTAPLAPEPLRAVLWDVLQRLLEETARRAGARFVPVPPAAYDRGLLREEYALDDNATHANPAFGALMWGPVFEAAAEDG